MKTATHFSLSILLALIGSTAVQAGTEIGQVGCLLCPPSLRDPRSDFRLYLMNASLGVMPSRPEKDETAVDVLLSPLRLQWSPFPMGKGSPYLGFSGSMGYAFSLENINRKGFQLELGLHVAQFLTAGCAWQRVADHGWNTSLRMAFNLGWTGPVDRPPTE